MILRIVHARLPAAGVEPVSLDGGRRRTADPSRDGLVRAAARVKGLETLVIGWHADDPEASAARPSRRDAPVAGRHTLLIRRRQDPAPTGLELDAAITEAFPLDPSSGDRPG